MSISFTGNYLYSFKNRETADKFRQIMDRNLDSKTRRAIDGSRKYDVTSVGDDKVLVLTGQDFADYRDTMYDMGRISINSKTDAFMREAVKEAYADKAMKVECGINAPYGGLKFGATV